MPSAHTTLNRLEALTDPRQALHDALALAASAASASAQAKAELLAAQRALELDEHQRALDSARQAAALFTQLQDQVSACEANLIALRALMNLNDAPAFERLTATILSEGEACGAWAVVANVHNLQGGMHLRHGKLSDAIASLERASALRRDISDDAGYAGSLNNLGLLHQRAGDTGRALEYFLACVAFIHASGKDLARQLGACLINVGALYRSMQLLDQAGQYLREGIAAVQQAQDLRMELSGVVALADVHRDRGDSKGAILTYLEALALAERTGAREEEAEVLDSLGRVYASLGEDALAGQMSRRALAIASELGLSLVQLWATLSLAHLTLKAGDAQEARHLYAAAREHAEQAGVQREVWQALEGEAQARRHLGDHAGAADLLSTLLSAERAGYAEREAVKLSEHQARFDVEKANLEVDTNRRLREAAEEARRAAEAAVQKRTEELEFAQVEIVTRLAAAAEYRDDQTGKHTFRVGHVSAYLAERLGMPAGEVDILRLAARLHDVGKIGIPDAILLKPGRFTPEEFDTMKQHAVIGARILSGGHSALLRAAEEIALTHHERWDGTGYPYGLSGEAIPLSGRLVSIADVYDALTSERPYKRAWTPQEALTEIEAQAGRQFDPRVVEAFGDMVRSGELERMAIVEDGHLFTPGAVLGERFSSPQVTADPDVPVKRPAHRLPEDVQRRLTRLLRDGWDARRDQPEHALALTQAALLLAEQHDDDLGRAYAQRNQGFACLQGNDLHSAEALLTPALNVAWAYGDLTLERDVTNLLAGVYSAMGRQQDARNLCETTRRLSAQLGDPSGEANALTNLGIIEAKLEQYAEATATFEQAARLYRAQEDHSGLANCLYNMADAALDAGDAPGANVLARDTIQAASQGGRPDLAVLALSLLACSHDAQGQHEAAAALHQQLRTALEPGRDHQPEAWGWAHAHAADNRVALGDDEAAVTLFEAAAQIAGDRALHDLQLHAHSRLVDLKLRQGDVQGAARHLQAERNARAALQ
ncbi:tetratricopeptide repeat protein (plasmid) [Deinococcus taeanensis]|uniref:HD domain-containing phosphohydrolase n=1 Tax=Deinococcus taeanensis TaxID=2737050 RepID=UPI001CDB9C54|nr:HD domain-containing phosphohydrolase [Deinococcus taeanensis]UBV45401.1 tetratricopeptide repeat protein [Deinococcus taeanensis]